tara:strand:+ start:346 stop:636 length:291 start_codon:yes stop_codon:yes gene_type:complete
MSTKEKIFAVLKDVDLLKNIINKSCNDQSKMLEYANRRETLGERMNKQKLECPECGTRQVQLVSYIDTYPAQWKCRHCKEEFVWEGDMDETTIEEK